MKLQCESEQVFKLFSNVTRSQLQKEGPFQLNLQKHLFRQDPLNFKVIKNLTGQTGYSLISDFTMTKEKTLSFSPNSGGIFPQS